MRSAMRLALVCAVVFFTLVPPATRARGSTRVENNERNFAWSLYETLAAESSGNFMASPYSLSSALAMTYAGARGRTAEEMARTLGFEPDPDKTAHTFSSLAQIMARDAGLYGNEFRIANSLWAQAGCRFRAPFMATLDSEFEAPLNQMDFADADNARRTINSWVGERTAGHVSDLLGPGSIDAMTNLVLINALCFKSEWKTPFSTSLTLTAQPFARVSADSVTTPTMYQHREFDYYENAACQVVEIPYKGQFSMIIVLPRKVEGLVLLDRIEMQAIAEWYDRKSKYDVELFLPRFRVRSKYSLKKELSAMGMPRAFVPSSADFSGITDSKQIFISDVAHEAWLDLDEEGTEAGAATAVMMEVLGSTPLSMNSTPPPHVVFKADHPFVFLITHVPTHTILFVGRITDPSVRS